jgi:hypothetical protein
MPGFANLFYLGQPDPAQQLARMLSGQQPQGAPPPAGPGPAGPGAAPPGAAPPGAAPDPNAPNPAPGAPPPPGSPPQPQALQSTPDMAAAYSQLANPPNIMSLYVQMQQRQDAMQGINQALAQIAANHSPPSMRQAIMQGVQGGGDAGQMVGNLMSLYQAQTQMGATQDMLQHASDYDTKLGLPPGTARDMILAGKGPDLISKMEPTDTQRNIQFEHDQFIKGGGTEEDWKTNYLPMIITGGLPGMTGDMKSMAFARTQWNNDPANKGRPMPTYLTDPTKWALYNKDLTDAKSQFNGMNQALTSYTNDLGEVAASPELKNVAGKPFTGALASAVPGTDAYNLLTKMQGLAGTSKAIAARGGPKGVGQNLAILGANSEDLTNLGITDYGDSVIAPRMRNALTAQANAYGAAGRLSDMPGYLKPYLDTMYQPGGDLDPGGPMKSFTPNKNLKQPDAEDLKAFQNDLEHYGPQVALKHLEAQGFDISSVK